MIGTTTRRRRKRARKGLFLPATALPEIQAAVSRLSTARALGLWLTIRAQMKMEGKEWVRVRTHLRESLGFSNRAAHSPQWWRSCRGSRSWAAAWWTIP